MNKTCIFLLPVLLAGLSSCGEGGNEAKRYFDTLGESLLSASKREYFRVYSDNAELYAGLKVKQEGKTQVGSIKLSPLCFDMRVDHPLDPSIEKTNVSIFGYNAKPTTVILGGDFKVSNLVSFNVKPRIYVDDGVLYTDLTEAGTLRLAINTVFGDFLSSSFPLKGKLDTGLPGGLSFNVPPFDKDYFVKTITSCHDVASSAFSFNEEGGIRTVSFSSTDKEQLALVAEALWPKGGQTPSASLQEAGSYYDLSRFSFSLSYTDIGPTSFEYDTAIRFKQFPLAIVEPDGEWMAKGKMNFGYGEAAKAVTVEDKADYVDMPIDWEKIKNVIADEMAPCGSCGGSPS